MTTTQERAGEPLGLHRAAVIEDQLHDLLEGRLRERGWRPRIIPFTGYGAPGWVRVMARVVLSKPPERSRRRSQVERGWRRFATLPVSDALVTIDAGGRRHEIRTDRGGYIDLDVEAQLAPGWEGVGLSTDGAERVEASVQIVDPATRFAVLSDVDDTVMVTTLPRPLLAAWNTFVLDEYARASVPGMAVLYERLVTRNPGTPVFYLSTGAWNVAPTLTRFLSRNLYPVGPLLLTDWGPTPDRWFRSGPAHKRSTLRRLASVFPEIRWLLIGDDGQHDEEIYADFAESHPDNVAAVAIRHLSPAQSVLAHGLSSLPDPAAPGASRPGNIKQPWVSAPDGAGLSTLLQETGLL